MNPRSVCLANLAILAGVFSALLLGAAFHGVNMNRKYWKMLNSGCIETNALLRLEQQTGEIGLAEHHVSRVPEWLADINSTLRLGVLAVAAGFVVNLVLMFRSRKEPRQ